MSNDSKSFCGVVFCGGGSSWAYGDTAQSAAERAAKIARSDWKGLIEFGKTISVNILNMASHEGWYADRRGIFDSDTGERIDVEEVIEV